MRALLFVIIAAVSSPVFAATPWVCMKDGQAIKIKAKGPKKKKKKCEAQGGTWEQKPATAAPAPKAPASEFDSSSGW